MRFKFESSVFFCRIILALVLVLSCGVSAKAQLSGEIADNTTTYFTQFLPNSVTIADINVTLDISHTRDQDLDVFLIAPDLTRVELFSDEGGQGNDFRGTILDDEANDSITIGYVPFNYRFQPEGLLSDFYGKDAQGIWTLEITDDRNKQVGTLNNWSIEVLTPGPPEFAIHDTTLTEGDQSIRFIDEFVPSGNGGLVRPQFMTWGPNGDLYVSSGGKVLRYDGETGAFIDVFVSAGGGSGVLFDNNEILYTTGGGGVRRYQGPNATSPGEFIDQFVASGSGGLESPNGLAFDDYGDLYVTDFYLGGVRRYAGPLQPNAGQYIEDFVPPGSGGLGGARNLLFHPYDGILYVVSAHSDAILRFQGPDGGNPGAFIDEFITGSNYVGPGAISVGPYGHFHVGFVSNGYLNPSAQVRRHQGPSDSSPGQLIDTFVKQGTFGLFIFRAILFDSNDNLYVGVIPTNAIARYGSASQAIFTVTLSSASTVPVSVDFSTIDGTATAGIDYLPLSGVVWFDPGVTTRTIIVQTIDDGIAESDETFSVELSNPSVGTAIIADRGTGEAIITDDDELGITVTPANGLTTTEAGGQDSFDIVLSGPPLDDVTIGISSSDTSEGTVDVSSLTFTLANWDTPQTVTVTGVDDAIEDGNVAYTIVTAAATSLDPDYNGLDADDANVTNLDDDGPTGGTQTYSSGNIRLSIPDNDPAGASSTISVGSGDAVQIVSLTITLAIAHSRSSDLTVTLMGPDGTEVTLTNFSGDNNVTAFNGISTQGLWTLKAVDNVGGRKGKINSWTIKADY